MATEEIRIIALVERIDAAAQRLAAEEGLQPRAVATARPHIVMRREHAAAAQIHVALAQQAAPPVFRHRRNRTAGRAEHPVQGVLQAAVDDALRGDGLAAAETRLFQQHGVKAALAQAVEQPQAGDAAAQNDDVSGKCAIHNADSRCPLKV